MALINSKWSIFFAFLSKSDSAGGISLAEVTDRTFRRFENIFVTDVRAPLVIF